MRRSPGGFLTSGVGVPRVGPDCLRTAPPTRPGDCGRGVMPYGPTQVYPFTVGPPRAAAGVPTPCCPHVLGGHEAEGSREVPVREGHSCGPCCMVGEAFGLGASPDTCGVSLRLRYLLLQVLLLEPRSRGAPAVHGEGLAHLPALGAHSSQGFHASRNGLCGLPAASDAVCSLRAALIGTQTPRLDWLLSPQEQIPK